MQKIFEALASATRRSILAYLSHGELTAGEIMSRFDMSKPSVSQHLALLTEAGLVESRREGRNVHYRLVREQLANTLLGFMGDVCPVARPLRAESRQIAKRKQIEREAGERFAPSAGPME